jgi:23S rRNA pseudouridine1911/1915/1917 synthase
MKLSDNDVIYEDNHLLALFKPAGLLTQPTAEESDSLETRAKAWLKHKYHKPGAVYLHAVHRLDKPVSGIVLFAKTSKALSRMNDALRSQACEKVYLAHIEGTLPQKEGILEHRLSHSDFAAIADPQGKPSRLRYKVLQKGVVEITLETGRYHQIRAQLALSGCPIIGDHKYGSKTRHESGIALCHVRFCFPHPITHQRIELTCEPFTKLH